MQNLFPLKLLYFRSSSFSKTSPGNDISACVQHCNKTATHPGTFFKFTARRAEEAQVIKKKWQRSSRGDSQFALLLSALLIPREPSVALKTLTSLLEPSQLHPAKEMSLGIENSVSSWLLLLQVRLLLVSCKKPSSQQIESCHLEVCLFSQLCNISHLVKGALALHGNKGFHSSCKNLG